MLKFMNLEKLTLKRTNAAACSTERGLVSLRQALTPFLPRLSWRDLSKLNHKTLMHKTLLEDLPLKTLLFHIFIKGQKVPEKIPISFPKQLGTPHIPTKTQHL